MPSCRVTNSTAQPLNICLKQVTALHFENGVQPGQTIKFRPGKVWFTLEAVLDDTTKKSRYSILKSAATIALLSIAIGAVAATAGAALLPETVVAGTVIGGYLAKGATVGKAAMSKAALLKSSGAIAKISSVALPKAIEKLSAELGGLSALQREVLSIIASPTLSSDVRHKATGLLHQLHTAYSSDKASRATSTTASATSAEPVPVPVLVTDPSTIPEDPATRSEAQQLEEELQTSKPEERVETTPVRTGEVLRVHGVYMSKRREFEVRVDGDGRMELWDKLEGKRVSANEGK